MPNSLANCSICLSDVHHVKFATYTDLLFLLSSSSSLLFSFCSSSSFFVLFLSSPTSPSFLSASSSSFPSLMRSVNVVVVVVVVCFLHRFFLLVVGISDVAVEQRVLVLFFRRHYFNEIVLLLAFIMCVCFILCGGQRNDETKNRIVRRCNRKTSFFSHHMRTHKKYQIKNEIKERMLRALVFVLLVLERRGARTRRAEEARWGERCVGVDRE